MAHWSTELTKINQILANLYDSREESERIVTEAGLDKSRVDFRTRAIDNWHQILLEANNRGKLNQLIEFAIKDSDNAELAKTYKEYQAAAPPGADGTKLSPGFWEGLWHWVKRHLIIVLTALGGFLVVAGAIFYFYFWRTLVWGYISCDASTPRAGQRLEEATVVILPSGINTRTNADGYFEIKVPRTQDIESLKVRYGGEIYPVQIKNHPDHNFNVVRCPVDVPPKIHAIEPEWWEEISLNSARGYCQTDNEITEVKLYLLSRSIIKTEEGSRLFVNINLPGQGKLIGTDVIRPNTVPPSHSKVPLPEPEDRVRRWLIEMPGKIGEAMEIKIQVCLGAPSGQLLSSSLLEGYYFFK